MPAEELPLILEPLLQLIHSAVGLVQVALGGIFGLYLLLVILRWWESRRLVMLLKDIRHQLGGISLKMGVQQEPRHTIRSRAAKLRNRVKKHSKRSFGAQRPKSLANVKGKQKSRKKRK